MKKLFIILSLSLSVLFINFNNNAHAYEIPLDISNVDITTTVTYNDFFFVSIIMDVPENVKSILYFISGRDNVVGYWDSQLSVWNLWGMQPSVHYYDDVGGTGNIISSSNAVNVVGSNISGKHEISLLQYNPNEVKSIVVTYFALRSYTVGGGGNGVYPARSSNWYQNFYDDLSFTYTLRDGAIPVFNWMQGGTNYDSLWYLFRTVYVADGTRTVTLKFPGAEIIPGNVSFKLNRASNDTTPFNLSKIRFYDDSFNYIDQVMFYDIVPTMENIPITVLIPERTMFFEVEVGIATALSSDLLLSLMDLIEVKFNLDINIIKFYSDNTLIDTVYSHTNFVWGNVPDPIYYNDREFLRWIYPDGSTYEKGSFINTSYAVDGVINIYALYEDLAQLPIDDTEVPRISMFESFFATLGFNSKVGYAILLFIIVVIISITVAIFGISSMLSGLLSLTVAGIFFGFGLIDFITMIVVLIGFGVVMIFRTRTDE